MSLFHFKHFSVSQSRSALKVGTDAMILGSLIEAKEFKRGLDVGSGTGVLSLMVAQGNPFIHIDAIELDEGAYMDSKENFSASNWSDRLNVLNANFLTFDTPAKYDLIFSNPPFYKDTLPSKDQRISLSKHATELSLEFLIFRSAKLLTEKGNFWVIFPFSLLVTMTDYVRNSGLQVKKRFFVEGKPERPTRIIFCLGFEEGVTEDFTIVIRTEQGKYTEQYAELTRAFHGKEIQ